MPLSPGDKLGPYEILAAIGAGGMGEVYRAHDTRLRRDVAIKVSAEHFSERFETEARAIASLNHPNVCTLHDVGPNYLVMELVEGETLAERIAQGAIPLDEALTIAKQIADALEAAHEKGITHRDLKPGNIKIKPDGVVKVLDFGLAKMGGTPTAKSDNSPTLTMGATQAGVILGTAAYMAPEQARGKVVDRRADIWAFGVVLYEMVTGQRLFRGEDLSETLASVIKDEPKLERVPSKVQRLVRSCLKKDPKQRLQAIGDWSLLLEDQAQPAKAQGTKLPWVVAALAIIGATVALWVPWRSEQQVGRPLVRLDVDLGADVSLPAPSYWRTVVISPDGAGLVYASGSPSKLFTRRLDQPKATELPGTEGASCPFFSPDGQWIGFRSSSNLNKVPVAGGAVVPLRHLAAFWGAAWGDDGNIIVSEYLKGLTRIPADGGPTEAVAELGGGEVALDLPQILLGGKALLFAAVPAADAGADRDAIEVLRLADHHRKILARGGESPLYLATSGRAGHLVYVNKAKLFAIPFDPDKLETHGTAVSVLEDVAYDKGGVGQFDFSAAPSGHGTLVYRKSSGVAPGITVLQWVDPSGKREPLRVKPGIYEHPSISPNGKRVALTVTEGGSRDIWVYDPQRDAMTRLTFDGADHSGPTWSPDGQSVVFSSPLGIFQTRADGAGQPQALTQSKVTQPASFTPDGKRLAYEDWGTGSSRIWTMPLEEQEGQLKAGKPEQFFKSGFGEVAQAFSPDGRWLAYFSNESGKPEVYVRPFPPPISGHGGKWLISNSGGMEARWSRTARELIYRSGDQFMAVSYTVKDDTFVPEKPRVWIDKLGGMEWDLAPDGKRVLVLTPVESAEAPKPEHEVVFLINFFDELRRRVPAAK
jgi:serine/threonine-protein kinase